MLFWDWTHSDFDLSGPRCFRPGFCWLQIFPKAGAMWLRIWGTWGSTNRGSWPPGFSLSFFVCIFHSTFFNLFSLILSLYYIFYTSPLYSPTYTYLAWTYFSLITITMGFALKRPDDAVGSAAPAIMIGLFVAFGGVLFGYVPLRSSILLFSKTSLTVI